MAEEQTAAHDEHSHHDKVFVVTFLAVLAVLVGIAVVIGIVANVIDTDAEMSDVAKQKVAERIAPVGGVYTDASQMPVAAEPAVAEAREPAEVLQTVCGACHNTGVLDAPKVGDAAAWKARLEAAGGLDGLVQSAITGKGAMPPRGGEPSLSDEDMQTIVELMVE